MNGAAKQINRGHSITDNLLKSSCLLFSSDLLRRDCYFVILHNKRAHHISWLQCCATGFITSQRIISKLIFS